MRVAPVEGRRRPFGLRGWLIVAAVLLVILLLSLRGLARFYTDYLWFKDVGFAHTWRALLSAKIVPALIFSAVFFVRDARQPHRRRPRRAALSRHRSRGRDHRALPRLRRAVRRPGPRARRRSSSRSSWARASRRSGRTGSCSRTRPSFGVKDPQFHKDISFYVFRLPFLQFVGGLDLRRAARRPDRLGRLPLPERRHPAPEPVPAGHAAGEGAPVGAARPHGADQDVSVLPGAVRAHEVAQRLRRRRHLHRRARAPSRAAPAHRHLDRGGRAVHRQHLAPGLGVPDHRGRAVGLHLDRRRHDLSRRSSRSSTVQPNELTKGAAVHRPQHRRDA